MLINFINQLPKQFPLIMNYFQYTPVVILLIFYCSFDSQTVTANALIHIELDNMLSKICSVSRFFLIEFLIIFIR